MLRFARVGVILYLGVVAWVTLGPAPWRVRASLDGYDVLSVSTWLSAGTWTSGRPVEFVANILLFVPLGVLVRLAVPGLSWVFAALVGSAVSGVVEVLQVGSTRVSDPRDLVANSLGALVGAVVVAVVTGLGRRASRPPQGVSVRLLVLSNISSMRENGVRKD